MLKELKQGALQMSKAAGAFALLKRSRWRQERLLILAYHGISLEDEHEWDPALFMSPALFRTRLETLKHSGYSVLALGEALQQLYANELPAKAVVLTFDDGLFDFYKCAYPILAEFNLPATVYLTTFYSHYNRPVFDVACAYLLWKGRGRTLELEQLTDHGRTIVLASTEARGTALAELQRFVRERELSAADKDALANAVATQLDLDYQEFAGKRILNLLTADEVRQVAAAGIDVQLHTHRHRTPRDRTLFQRELLDNRASIKTLTGQTPTHFCYPSGVYDLSFLPWLQELGVESATTCDPGLASSHCNPLLLPRLIDTSTIKAIEFEGWLTGMSAFLPRRQIANRRSN